MPRVSIIMGVYNGFGRMDRSIQSIINQTYKDWEFIICDDGSTDDTYMKLQEYAALDNRIVVLKNAHNSGLAQSLNNCLSVAKGEYVARMDDDDYSHSERLEKEVYFLNQHPEYAIVATGRNMVDESGVWGQDTFVGERSALDIYKGRMFAHPTVMIRKEAYDRVGGYSTYPGIGREEDTDLWCKMYAKGFKGYVTGEKMLDYYESRHSMTRRKFKYRFAETRIKLKYRKYLGIPFYLIPLAFKPILVGLLPKVVLEMYHHHIFNKY